MTKTLVLSAAMQPVSVVPWQDAMTLLSKNAAEVVEEYDECVGMLPIELIGSYREFMGALRLDAGTAIDGGIPIKMPAVIRVRKFFVRHSKKPKFSRINVFTRDGFTCQYCKTRFAPMQAFKKLTYDHVVPRHQGGRTSWTNIVTACYTCNGKKANMTPEQAGMKLLSRPRMPDELPITFNIRLSGSYPVIWEPYVSWLESA